jgi:hypothetical protein
MNPPPCRAKGVGVALALAVGALVALGAIEMATSLADLAAAVHLGA